MTVWRYKYRRTFSSLVLFTLIRESWAKSKTCDLYGEPGNSGDKGPAICFLEHVKAFLVAFRILYSTVRVYEFLKATKQTNKLVKIDIIFFKHVKILKIFVEKRIRVQLYLHLA